MMKWVGAVIILLSCGFAGRILAATLARRVNLLQQLERGFAALSTEINFSVTALPSALKQSGRQCGGEMKELFVQAGERFFDLQGIPAEIIWQQTVDEVTKDSALLQEDRNILYDFGLGLGLSDKSDQLKKLELLLQKLRSQEQDARTNKEKMSKVWQALGWSMGAMLVLLFI